MILRYLKGYFKNLKFQFVLKKDGKIFQFQI